MILANLDSENVEKKYEIGMEEKQMKQRIDLNDEEDEDTGINNLGYKKPIKTDGVPSIDNSSVKFSIKYRGGTAQNKRGIPSSKFL